MEVVSSFKYFGSCFSGDGGPQEDTKVKVTERLKTSGALKMTLYVKSVVCV